MRLSLSASLPSREAKVISFSQGSVSLALFHGLMHSMMPIIFKCILDPEQNLSARACARPRASARVCVCDYFSCGGRGGGGVVFVPVPRKVCLDATESLSGCHGKSVWMPRKVCLDATESLSGCFS